MSRSKLLQQVIAVTLVMLMLVGCGTPAATPVSEAPAATPVGGGTGRVAFVSARADYDFFLMDIDTLEQIILTDGLSIVIQPDWSPDGTKIAFSGTLDERVAPH
jgi:hypothetical protein